jgi:hypothetical protein
LRGVAEDQETCGASLLAGARGVGLKSATSPLMLHQAHGFYIGCLLVGSQQRKCEAYSGGGKSRTLVRPPWLRPRDLLRKSLGPPPPPSTGVSDGRESGLPCPRNALAVQFWTKYPKLLSNPQGCTDPPFSWIFRQGVFIKWSGSFSKMERSFL